jgi:hypothetical protein
MVDDTLPPGTTHRDIDKHFGGEDPIEYEIGGHAGVGLSVKARDKESAEETAMKRLREIAGQHDSLHFYEPEIEHVERP